MPVDVPEYPAANEIPADYVLRVAGEKVAAAELVAGVDRPILAADTEVILNDRIFGKPRDYEDFAEMMRQLSGTEHTVLSAVVLRWRNHMWSALCKSGVTFAPLSEQTIDWYWGTGEPLGKAGGYAIQGKGALLVAGLRGSYSSVMGLPLFETANLLIQAGVPVLQESKVS